MLKGKTALVTGSTSGIGLGIARALAAQGANIVFNGFGEAAAIEALRQEVAGTHGVQTLYHPADMTQPAEIRALVQAADALGGVDVLVNNAGIQYVAPVDEFPEERWDAIIAINLTSNFHAIKAALPGMKTKGWGRIINIASVHGLVASANKSAYVAAKHGVVGLTKAVALETAATPITCNAICPGWVLTALVQKQIDDRAAAQKLSACARRRLIRSAGRHGTSTAGGSRSEAARVRRVGLRALARRLAGGQRPVRSRARTSGTRNSGAIGTDNHATHRSSQGAAADATALRRPVRGGRCGGHRRGGRRAPRRCGAVRRLAGAAGAGRHGPHAAGLGARRAGSGACAHRPVAGSHRQRRAPEAARVTGARARMRATGSD